MVLKKDNNVYNIKMCIKFKDRLIGLCFKKNINEVLCFPRCNSIHTFFMFSKIDVIMCDKNFKIIKIIKNLKPNRIILPQKNVYYIIEAKPNQLKFNIGERIKII